MSVIKFPDVVPVGSQLYTVIVAESLPDNGACDRENKTIWIEDNPDNERIMLLTWFHEIMHAGEQEYGYKLTDEDDNSDIDRIAQTVVQAVLALVEAQ